jgi:hypothetical protein
MKKLSLFVALIIGFCVAESQNIQSGNKVSGPKTVTDTIFLHEFLSAGTPTLPTSTLGGYMFGTNKMPSGPGFTIDAEGYHFPTDTAITNYGISEVLIRVGALKKTSASGTSMSCQVMKIDGSNNYLIGSIPYSISCPNTILGTATIPFADIDTNAGHFTIATFNPPVNVDTNYAVAVDFSSFYTNSDTIGFLASANGGATASGAGLAYTWMKFGTKWYQASHYYSGSDLSIAFFPVVDTGYGNVINDYFINGIKLSCYPNPVQNNAVIKYTIEKEADITFEMIDSKGQLILTSRQGKKAAGEYSYALDARKLATGTYFISVIAGSSRLTKKIIISK